MQPNVANFGDTVVELAALANTAAIVSAAVVGAWVTWHIRKSTPYSVGAFFGGAGAGFAIGQLIARILYRSHGMTLVVKAGMGSLSATIPAGLIGAVVAALVVAMLVWIAGGRAISIWSLLPTVIACGIVIGVGLACSSSLI
jgi:hypothetical protein